jgi:CDP-paratose synthetase
MKTILIVGANGFLGKRIARYFKKKYNIIGIVRSLPKNNHDGILYVISDKNELVKVFKTKNVDFIIYAATVYRPINNNYDSIIDSNLVLPLQLFSLAKKYQIKAFLNIDSFFNNSKYNYSYLPEYTLSKKHLLEWLKLSLPKTNVKLFNMKIFHMYGKDDSIEKFIPSIIHKMKNNEPFIDLTYGEQKRDFIHIEDVIRAFEIVLISYQNLPNFDKFEIGTGESTSIRDFILLVKNKLKSSTRLNFGKLEYRENEIMFSKAVNSKLIKLGWKVHYDLEEGVLNVLK